jgi:hypothetical protein
VRVISANNPYILTLKFPALLGTCKVACALARFRARSDASGGQGLVLTLTRPPARARGHRCEGWEAALVELAARTSADVRAQGF